MTKRFLYLVQAKDDLPPSYAELRHDDADLLVLTWGKEKPGDLFFPRSTWTQGRNRLRQEALREGQPDYLYYIFLDDDVILTRGSWRLFEQMLLKYEPALAAPYYKDFPRMRGSNLALEAHGCDTFDAMCTALHREVFRDDLILPYREDFDGQSWWFSQWFVIQLSRLFLHDSTIQINCVEIENTRHGEYPRFADFYGMRTRFYRSTRPFGAFLARLLPALWTARLFLASMRLKWLCWSRFHLPNPRKPGSYAIPAQKRRRLLDETSELWRGRL